MSATLACYIKAMSVCNQWIAGWEDRFCLAAFVQLLSVALLFDPLQEELEGNLSYSIIILYPSSLINFRSNFLKQLLHPSPLFILHFTATLQLLMLTVVVQSHVD